MKKTFWFDLETTGLDALRQGRGYHGIVEAGGVNWEGNPLNLVAKPTGSVALSEHYLAGKTRGRVAASTSALTEKDLVQQLISQFQSHDVIAGYNIDPARGGFDINFLRGRAQALGLGQEFAGAIQGKEVLDVAHQYKQLLGSCITSSLHPGIAGISKGWEAYMKDPSLYPLAGKGWTLGSTYEFFTGKSLEKAHQASADALATRELFGGLGEAEKAFSAGWEDRFLGIVARAEKKKGNRVLSSFLKKTASRAGELPLWGKVAAGAGVVGLGLIQAQPFRLFSGRDDEYNTIEGLPHGGFAGALRKKNTDFGSGYQGMRVHGQVIAPEIQAFRDKWYSSPEAEVAVKEKLAGSREGTPGEFEKGDLYYTGGKTAQIQNLSQFKLKWEDADTLALSYPWWKFWKNDISIRLAGIDAPETSGHGGFWGDPTSWFRFHQSQPHGKESAAWVRELTEGQNLRVEVAADPQARTYGRYLGLVYREGQKDPVNLELVRAGQAAALPWGEAGSDIYSREKLKRVEKEAIQEQRGIWGLQYFQKYLDISKGMGGRLTFNTLTDLTRLAKNYNLAAAESWMSNDNAAYRPFVGQYIGKKLIPSYGRFFSGRGRAGNTIEGFRHEGIAGETRSRNTDFGSGYQGQEEEKGSILPWILGVGAVIGGGLLLSKFGSSKEVGKGLGQFLATSKSQVNYPTLLKSVPKNTTLFSNESLVSAIQTARSSVFPQLKQQSANALHAGASFFSSTGSALASSISSIGKNALQAGRSVLGGIGRGVSWTANLLSQTGKFERLGLGIEENLARKGIGKLGKRYYELRDAISRSASTLRKVRTRSVAHHKFNRDSLRAYHKMIETMDTEPLLAKGVEWEEKYLHLLEGPVATARPLEELGLKDYYLHATSDASPILASGHLFPGSVNYAHGSEEAGVYFSTTGQRHLSREIPKDIFGRPEHSDEIIAIAKSKLSLHRGEDPTEAFTRNESVRFGSVREFQPSYPRHIPEPKTSVTHEIREADTPHLAKGIISNFRKKVTRAKSKLETSTIRDALQEDVTKEELWLREFADSSLWYKNVYKQHDVRPDLTKAWDAYQQVEAKRTRVLLADEVSLHPYDPSHVARPTKVVQEGGMTSLAFGHAEEQSYMSAQKLSTHRRLRAFSAELKSRGAQLHIKGGTARERLVRHLRPEWGRNSKDLDLLVTGDVATPELYDLMEKHGVFADISTAKDLPSFFRSTDMTANQAVIAIPSRVGEHHRLYTTEGAVEDIKAGVIRYTDQSDPGRAAQRIAKFKGYYPGAQVNTLPRIGESFNPIEGMSEKGINAATRKTNTEFGSRYDVVRKAAEALGTTFEELTRSAEFQQALLGAKLKKVLGEGAFGRTSLYQARFRGHKFKFVKKTLWEETDFARNRIARGTEGVQNQAGHVFVAPANVYEEASALYRLGESPMVPSAYHATEGELFMEYMPGVRLSKLKGKEFQVGQTFWDDLADTAAIARQEGIEHLDLHLSNIGYNPKTGRGVIYDWGMTRQRIPGQMFDERGFAFADDPGEALYRQVSQRMTQARTWYSRGQVIEPGNPNFPPDPLMQTPVKSASVQPAEPGIFIGMEEESIKSGPAGPQGRKCAMAEAQQQASARTWEAALKGGRQHLTRHSGSDILTRQDISASLLEPKTARPLRRPPSTR